MKKKLIIILTSCCLCFTFVGCSNLFAPEDENNRGEEVPQSGALRIP